MMNFKNAKIRMLDLDLRGCVYLNHFSHSQRVAWFFKGISRLGDWFFLVCHVGIGLDQSGFDVWLTNPVFGSGWFSWNRYL